MRPLFPKVTVSRWSQFRIGTARLAPRSHLVSEREMGIKKWVPYERYGYHPSLIRTQQVAACQMVSSL